MGSITNANRSRAADAVCARANNGSVKLYNGAPPADAGTALSGNTLLASLAMSATAFAAAVNGVAAANAITASTAVATGRPSFLRIFESDGTTVVCQMRCALAWLGSTGYSVGDRVSNGGKDYVCTTAGTSAASGGPTGTGTGITDGTAVWSYEAPSEVVMTLVSQLVSGGNVSISALSYTQAAA